MAKNPMQKKAKINFFIGMLLAFLISALVIGMLLIKLKDYRDKESEELQNSRQVLVLNQDVISGQIITKDMLKEQTINQKLIPVSALGDTEKLDYFSLQDKDGNDVITEYKNGQPILYLERNNTKYEMKKSDTENYYIEVNENKEFVDLNEVPIIAKVDLYKNSILTLDLITKSNEKTTDDLRKQEYNVLVLPTQIETGEYVDVRLALPTGQDYIVVSKKQVELPVIDGTDSEDTIWLKLTEDEIITMNNAIVDAYKILGSKLYITTYTEAGTQAAAIPTYIPSLEVAQLIQLNPNIVDEAKSGLIARYNSMSSTRNDVLNPALSNSGTEGEEKLKTKVEESITKSKETRKQYLDSLSVTTE